MLYIYICSFVLRMCLINSGDEDVDILSAHLRPTLMILNIDDAAAWETDQSDILY